MNRQRFDPVSLVLGLVTIAVGLGLLLQPSLAALARFVGDVTAWWPLLLVVVGVWIIAATTRRSGAGAADETPNTHEAGEAAPQASPGEEEAAPQASPGEGEAAPQASPGEGEAPTRTPSDERS